MDTVGGDMEKVLSGNTDEFEGIVYSTPQLKVADRCDRCIAQAFVIASKDDKDLYFCAHHFYKYQANLIEQGFDVHDETYRINASPSSDPDDFNF